MEDARKSKGNEGLGIGNVLGSQFLIMGMEIWRGRGCFWRKVIASKCGKKSRDVIREGVNIIGKGSKRGKNEIMQLEDENETTIVGKLLKEGRKFCKRDSLENFLVEIYLAFLLLIIWFVFQLKLWRPLGKKTENSVEFFSPT